MEPGEKSCAVRNIIFSQNHFVIFDALHKKTLYVLHTTWALAFIMYFDRVLWSWYRYIGKKLKGVSIYILSTLRYIFPKFYVILFLVLDSDNMRIADSKWAIYTTREVLFENKKKNHCYLSILYVGNIMCSIRYDCRLCIHIRRI